MSFFLTSMNSFEDTSSAPGWPFSPLTGEGGISLFAHNGLFSVALSLFFPCGSGLSLQGGYHRPDFVPSAALLWVPVPLAFPRSIWRSHSVAAAE